MIKAQNYRTEWQIWLLIILVYFAWLFLLWAYGELPGAALLLVVVNAFHGSIQHELLHNHPTRNPRLNDLLAYLPLSLWYPYPIYKRTHMQHHQEELLTLPGIDPESFYVTRQDWQKMSALRQKLTHFNMTLAGRMLIGPALTLEQLCRLCVTTLLSGEAADKAIWWWHIVLVSSLLTVLLLVFSIPVWQYFLIAYASQALSMLRSFFEHRAVIEPKHRSIIMEACLPMRLLFTNNNYHLLHHEQPTLAWYLLPAEYQRHRQRLQEANNGFVVAGYGQWWRQYLFKPVDNPVHPFYPSHTA